MSKKIEKLTLAQLLPHIDFLHYARIIDAMSPGKENILFEGSIMDVPWVCLDMVLDTAEDGEAISCDTIVNEHGVTFGRITIYVKDDEDD